METKVKNCTCTALWLIHICGSTFWINSMKRVTDTHLMHLMAMAQQRAVHQLIIRIWELMLDLGDTFSSWSVILEYRAVTLNPYLFIFRLIVTIQQFWDTADPNSWVVPVWPSDPLEFLSCTETVYPLADSVPLLIEDSNLQQQSSKSRHSSNHVPVTNNAKGVQMYFFIAKCLLHSLINATHHLKYSVACTHSRPVSRHNPT